MRGKNRIRKLHKGYDKTLKPFKREMIGLMESNKVLAVAICETYRAGQYSSQYWRTIGYFGRGHKAAYIGFCKTGLPGKVLCGRDEFWLTLGSCGYSDIYEEYKNAIPEKKAFGIIFGNALRIINKR